MTTDTFPRPMPTATDDLLTAWRKARKTADDLHRRALDDADKIYKLWLDAQKDDAVRGAVLASATWEDRLAALQALSEATLHMRKPGDWYVSMKSTSVSNGFILSSGAGNGATPEEAVEDIWQRYTNLAEGEVIAVGYGEERTHALWVGDGWKTWTPNMSSNESDDDA